MSMAPKSKLVQTLTGGTTLTDAAVNGTAVRTDGHLNNTFAFKNTTDVVVTVTFQGSNNSAFTKTWTLPGSVTLAATTGSDYEVLSQAWTYVRPVYTPTGTASSGTVTFEHIASSGV